MPRLAVQPELFYRLFYPQVPLLLSAKAGGEVAAMPAVSCMAVSDHPAIIAVAVGSSLRTNRIMKKARNFAISWIDYNHRKILELLSFHNKRKDKLRGAGIDYLLLFGAPVPKVSVAYGICQKMKAEDLGNHTLFLGKVIGAMASTDFDEYWKFSDYPPVIYRGSKFKTPFVTLKRSG